MVVVLCFRRLLILGLLCFWPPEVLGIDDVT